MHILIEKEQLIFESIYRRTSLARTLMARSPWLFRTRTCVLGKKNPMAADFG